MGAEKRINGCGEEKLYFGATVGEYANSLPVTWCRHINVVVRCI